MSVFVNANNVAESIQVTAQGGNCQVALTGAHFAANTSFVTTEQYGPDYTSFINVAPAAALSLNMTTPINFV